MDLSHDQVIARGRENIRASMRVGSRAEGLAALAAYVIAIGALLVLAALHVLKPLDGDQASFLLGAKAIEEGGRLYVDYWDLKQPGVFLFYWLAGRLFGFNAWGVHLGELVYWATVAFLSVPLLRKFLVDRRLAFFVPVLFLAFYFGSSTAWHATQVEALVGGPLLLAILLVATGMQNRDKALRWYFFAGIVAGFALWLKFAFAPAFLAIFAAIWIRLWFIDGERAASRYLLSAVFVIVGVAAVSMPMLLWFEAGNNLAALFEASLYPMEAIAAGVSGSSVNLVVRALNGLAFVSFALAPLLLLVGLALIAPGSLSSPLMLLSLLALTGAAASLLMQVISYWEYHFQLFFMPVVIIAVASLDRLTTSHGTPLTLANSIPVGLLVAVLLVLAQLGKADQTALKMFAKKVVIEKSDREAFEAAVFPQEAQLQAAAARSGLTEPGANIYVFGNPAIYHILGARQAVSVLGWFWEMAAPRLLEQTIADLQRVRPVRIHVSEEYRSFVATRAPELKAWLDQEYEIISDDDGLGTWYALSGT